MMADALDRNALPSLKRLHLDSCGLRDDGFVALVSGLEQNTGLQIISLTGHGNDFGERGIMALAEAFERTKAW
jgi:hypothetical protein